MVEQIIKITTASRDYGEDTKRFLFSIEKDLVVIKEWDGTEIGKFNKQDFFQLLNLLKLQSDTDVSNY